MNVISPPAPQKAAPPAANVAKALRGFIADIGPGVALSLEACVHCGQCAEACQFYVQTGDPRYTPIHKVEL